MGNYKDHNKEKATAKRFRHKNRVAIAAYADAYLKTPSGRYSVLMSIVKGLGQKSDISRDAHRRILQSPCHYCGGILNAKGTGLDQVIAKGGYVLSNVVPCCKRCNQSKNSLTLEEFYQWVADVYRSIPSSFKGEPMIIEPKNYETPETGEFLGTIIDVIDVGKKMTPWGEKHKLQIAWVLNALDSQGKPFRILREMPISMNEKSNLYQTARDVFAPQILPPGAFETEWLVGRANRLFIKKELPNDKGRVYANIISIMPLKAGDVPPVVPGDYVRAHLRQVTAVNPQARPAAVQFGQPATVAVQAVSAQPAPTVVAAQPNVFVPPAGQTQQAQPSPVKF